MRFKSLKLSGFKSFVDTTQLLFPGALSAIVGPNGCGKSNTIDAVRWVMGEASAKNLRGDSMADVIFNGSKERNPVGQASVELMFDNSAGKIQGQYAAYNEIAVRRVVNRDGHSGYYLNNTKCRRRDIMDLFLGTGIGPRSYSIIEQGTISRIIEARPEDLRTMVEEAAGISKYRERRRETENRMRHTKENLSRVDDLRNEIDKLINRLHRQAQTATRYKKHKTRQRALENQLLVLQWQEFRHTADNQQQQVASCQTELDRQTTKVRGYETEFTAKSNLLHDANEQLNQVQADFYQNKAQVDSLEQNLQSVRAMSAQIKEDADKANLQRKNLQQILSNDQTTIQDLNLWLDEQRSELTALKTQDTEATAHNVDNEQKWQSWQDAWQKLHQDAAEPEKNVSSEQARIQHLEQTLRQHEKRRTKLTDELDGIVTPPTDDDMADKIKTAKLKVTQFVAAKEQKRQEMEKIKPEINYARQKLDELKKQYQEARGALVSLQTLQQAGYTNDKLQAWLRKHTLENNSSLLSNITVEPKWQLAVETVLADSLNALCLDKPVSWPDLLAETIPGNLDFIEITAAISGEEKPGGGRYLSAVISSKFPLDSLLQGVHIAENIDEALTIRKTLANNESVVCREGIWFGSNWVRSQYRANDEDNLLQREHNIRQLTRNISQLEQDIRQLEQQIAAHRSAQQQIDKQHEQNQLSLEQAHAAYSSLQAQASVAEDRRQRTAAIVQELSELENYLTDDQQSLTNAQTRLQQAMLILKSNSGGVQELQTQGQVLKAELEKSRQHVAQIKNDYHQRNIKYESKLSRKQELEVHIVRIEQQIDELAVDKTALVKKLTAIEEPVPQLQNKLTQISANKTDLEQNLTAAKARLLSIEEQKQELEKQRNKYEKACSNTREELEKIKFKAQDAAIRAQTVVEELEEAQVDKDALLAELSTDSTTTKTAQELADIKRKIQNMGAINLAAIDEYDVESERKKQIDQQHEDLSAALQTLESVISKIDKESKERFNTTYKQVNENFARLFPLLFGGGRASLELTSDNLLETGINVQAQPPGKRNSSIYLLSGGEKALTAVALVFAIFELNPAPFCMLDEVDAPLDDANVERFCQMVRKMSEYVQFIIVTHNKITMSLANQLTGVTMQEPGVSRIVTVDIDQVTDMI